MSKLGERLDRAVDRLDGVVTDHVSLRRALADLLRRHLGYELGVVATVDPTTTMWTHCLLDGMDRDERLEAAVFDNEYCVADVLKLTDLRRLPGRVGTLQAVTGGDLSASVRLREIYRPAGFDDELRLLLADGDSAWGVVCLLRSGAAFSEEETRALAAVGPRVAVMLRRSLLHAAVQRPDALEAPPGLLVCGADGTVVDVSDEARHLLAGSGPDEIPQVVTALLAKRAAGERAEAALPTVDGRWLAFHATRLGDRDVVIVEQVRTQRLAELIVRAHGLSLRERDVVEAVARGLSTKEIAARLFISEWTVQDHLKAIFAKFAVRSRQELVAAVFFDHYGPRHAAEDTPSPYGWYLEGEPDEGRTTS